MIRHIFEIIETPLLSLSIANANVELVTLTSGFSHLPRGLISLSGLKKSKVNKNVILLNKRRKYILKMSLILFTRPSYAQLLFLNKLTVLYQGLSFSSHF